MHHLDEQRLISARYNGEPGIFSRDIVSGDSALFGRPEASSSATRFEKVFDRITEYYGVLLDKALRWRWLVTAPFVSLLVLGTGLILNLGGEFLPRMDDGRIMIKVMLPTGASLSETERVLRQIEQKIGRDEAIESVFTLVGGKVKGLYTYEIANEGEINIQLVPRSKRKVSTKEYIAKLPLQLR